MLPEVSLGPQMRLTCAGLTCEVGTVRLALHCGRSSKNENGLRPRIPETDALQKSRRRMNEIGSCAGSSVLAAYGEYWAFETGRNEYACDASSYLWRRSCRAVERRRGAGAGRVCQGRYFEKTYRVDRWIQLQQLGAVRMECLEDGRRPGGKRRSDCRTEDHHRKR